jgi:hypothetical protein
VNIIRKTLRVFIFHYLPMIKLPDTG